MKAIRGHLLGLTLGLFALQLAPLVVSEAPDIVAVFEDPAIVAGINSAAAAQPSSTGVITVDDLPARRPPTQGYNFCDYGCASQIDVAAGGNTNGALELDISHQAMTGVTADMITWMFNKLNGKVKYVGNGTSAGNGTRTAQFAGGGQTYPMYLILHRRDHMFHKSSSLPVTPGVTKFTWCEMPMTNCKYNPQSGTHPWSCPAGAKGYLRNTKPAVYKKKFQLKQVMSVSRFDRTGAEWNTEVDLSDFSPLLSGKRVIATTRHTWSDDPSKPLKMRTQMWLGMMAEGSTTDFDTTPLGSAANVKIINQYLNGATNIQNKNMTQAGWMNVLHILEEYGGLKDWLPQMYNGRKR